MKIDGTVTTGLGKAAYFLSQDFYVNNFKKIMAWYKRKCKNVVFMRFNGINEVNKNHWILQN